MIKYLPSFLKSSLVNIEEKSRNTPQDYSAVGSGFQ